LNELLIRVRGAFIMNLKNNSLILGRSVSILLCTCSVIITSGCSTAIKMSYSPAYIEKITVVKSNISKVEATSILLLPFKDKRRIKNPSLIYKRISLDNQTLSDYLSDALYNDLKLIGFSVTQNNDKELNFEDIEVRKKAIDDNVRFVLAVEINKCIPDYEMNFTTVQAYSMFDFKILIWDNSLSKVVYDSQLFKKIMGVETAASTFVGMVDKLLNEDLTVVNVDIAEILATSLSENRSRNEEQMEWVQVE